MLDRILVALMLSTLVMTPAKALDDILEDAPPVAARVPYTKWQAASDVYEGGKGVIKGTGNIVWGVGSTLYDLGRIGQGCGKFVGAAKEIVLAPLSSIYSDNAGKHIGYAQDYASSSKKDFKAVYSNIPTTYNYFKEGVTGVASGTVKLGTPAYEGIKAAIESETGQRAKAAVVSAAYSAGEKIKEGASYLGGKVAQGFSWFGSKVAGAFGKLSGFNDQSFNNIGF